MGQTSCHIFEGAGGGLNSLTFGQGGEDPPLWFILTSKAQSNHTLGHNISFVATF